MLEIDLLFVCLVCRVVPQYLMYRPANAVPYATVEADLKGVYLKYCTMDPKGTLITATVSELEQKCCSFQHWIHQWTHGNLLVTQLEGRRRTHTVLLKTVYIHQPLVKVAFPMWFTLQVLKLRSQMSGS